MEVLPSSFVTSTYAGGFSGAADSEADRLTEFPVPAILSGLQDIPGVPTPRAAPLDEVTRCAARLNHPAIRAQAESMMQKGTTTIGFVYKGGVILAADARASYQTGYLASPMVKKLIPINSRIVGTMAGGAADCQYWQNWLSYQARRWELRTGKPITIAAASKILANVTYAYRFQGLSMGCMVGGVDEHGFHLYRVDQVGCRSKQDINSDGSGCLWAWGVLDTGYKPDLTDEEAIDLATRCIFTAAHRDAYSGCRINVIHIGQDGWKQVLGEPFRALQEKFEVRPPPPRVVA